MKHDLIFNTRFFFSTAPLPCPYLPDRMERRVVTELIGRDTLEMHEQLSLAGFRRSHGIAYAAACAGCNACKAVRVLANEFKCGRAHRRVRRRNADIIAQPLAPFATEEQFQLFAAYQRARHSDGEMSKMDFFEYQGLVQDTPVETEVVEFRDLSGDLIAVCLTDRMINGLSAVYSFFDPKLDRRSLGTYMILWLIEEAQRRSMAYVYLGFWIAECAKMAYKLKFSPLEVRTSGGWGVLGGKAIEREILGGTSSRDYTPEAPINLTFSEIL